ncbi:MAG TPA: hypothetical protein VGD62_05175 [Acidobacteriaceae bacterium]
MSATLAHLRRLLLLAATGAVLVQGPRLLRAQQPSATPPAQTAAPQPTPAPKPKAAPDPADDNAFPQEQSEAAQKAAQAEEKADRKAASSGPAEPEANASSSRDKFKGVDLLGQGDSRTANGAGGTIVDPALSTRILHVGQQYMGMGNYSAAYQRFKEACAVDPANVEAVFYLAEAARRTAHLDESATNYHIYLDAQPAGPKAKAARKALAQLQGK